MNHQTLVVFYSHTDMSRRVARMLSSEFGWATGEISDRHARVGAAGAFRCVLDTLLLLRPAIRYEGPDPRDFDSVVCVAPIWLSRMAAPMRTFIEAQASRMRRVAVISVMGHRGSSCAAAEADRLMGYAPALSASFMAREVGDGSYAPRLAAFGRAVRATRDIWPIERPRNWVPSAG